MKIIVTLHKQIRATELLEKLLECLSHRGETNWIRGISAALGEIALLTDEGFANARSLYRTMMEGGRGFAEYCVWDEDESQRQKANKEIDGIRTELWEIFES